MNDTYSNLENIARQIEFPDKPSFGSITDLLLFIIAVALSVGCFKLHASTAIFRVILSGGFCIFATFAMIVAVSVIKKYVTLTKEYTLAQEDIWAYRQYKAIQFLRQNDKNINENKMFVEWMQKHPKKNKLPEFVKIAIREGDPLTLQYYLDWVAENKEKEK